MNEFFVGQKMAEWAIGNNMVKWGNLKTGSWLGITTSYSH
jgi:hypothetical protein